ncbi:MAG: tetratricopeptide repeat protein, partial [Myxococcota bacterium]|nr:tetratricopeptide repeat protein [Myxococcota bacterium]
ASDPERWRPARDGTTFRQLIQTFHKVCVTMAYAHSKGVIHRDLKPGNILLTSVAGDPHFAKVLDFGLAKVGAKDNIERSKAYPTPAEGLTSSEDGLTIGTPAYISPEQAQNRDVDERADVYALGVIACQLLTGRLPFEGRNAMALLMAHVLEEPTLPSALAPDLGFFPGGPVDMVVARALAKAPADRYASARGLAEAIVAAVRRWHSTQTNETPHPRFSSSAELDIGGLDTQIDLYESIEGFGPRDLVVLYLQFDEVSQGDTPLSPEDQLECLAVVAAKTQLAVQQASGRLGREFTDRQVAVFGLGGEGEAAENALTAALTISSSLRALPDDPTMPPGFQVAFRIGVDVGPVHYGEMGDIGTVIHGDAVYSARRLAQRGISGQVRLSQRGYRRVRGIFDAEPVRARGTGRAWVVTGRKAVARTAREAGIHGVTLDLIGRKGPGDILRETLDRATAQRQLHTVHLYGPAGVGKTRVVWDFLAWNEERPDSFFLDVGRCTQGHHHGPYEPILQALRTRAGLAESEGAEAVRTKARHFVRRYLAEDATQLTEEDERFVVLLEELFGLTEEPTGGDTSQILAEETGRSQLFDRIAALYRRLSERLPLTVFIDDFQWASSPTRALIGALLSRLTDTPTFFVLVSRVDEPDGEPPSLPTDPAHVTPVRLAPLPRRDAERLTRHALRALVEVPEPLVRAICDLAQGIPLIIEETIHDLIDAGVILVERKHWRLGTTTVGRLRLPRTVEQLLVGRVNKLPVPLREALEVAAVAGKRFWPEQLHSLVEGAEEAGLLVELVQRGFVTPRRELELEGMVDYGFCQLAMQEAVYGLVARPRRSELHRQVASWLEARVKSSSVCLDDELGHHYQQAGEHDLALRCLERAAKRAAMMYAIDEAVSHTEACLTLYQSQTGGDPKEQRRRIAETQTTLVHLLTLSGDLPRAVQLADEALSAAADHPEETDTWTTQLVVRKANVLMSMGRYREAADAFDAAVDALVDVDYPALELKAHTGRAIMQARLGDAGRGVEMAQAALDTYGERVLEDLRGQAELSGAYRTLGHCELWRGRHAAAREAYDEAFKLAVAANAPELIIEALNGRAAYAFFLGHHDDADTHWRQALEIAQRWDLVHLQLVIYNNIGELAVHRGDRDEALTLLARAEALGRFLGSDDALADTHRNLAMARLATGDFKEAERHARRALDHANRIGSPHFLGPIHRTLAQIYQARREHPGGRPVARTTVLRHLDAAIESFEAAGMDAEFTETQRLRDSV